MNKKTTGIALLLLLLIGGAGAWALLGSNDTAEFTHVKQLQDKLIHDESLSEEERDAGWREVKQKWSTFSEEEQQKLYAPHRNKKNEQVSAYFALKTDKEREAHIDKVIDEWGAKKKDGEANATKNRGDKKGKDKASGKSDEKQADGKEDYKAKDPESMRQGLRDFLDSKSADERAKERIYWTRVKQRWAERHGSLK